ncbi:TadE/TadG family type IV pilus assembly protein [Nocardiopsis coralliicola]
MRTPSPHGRARERGSAAVELALLTPLLISLALLIVLAHRLISAGQGADAAAHAAARAATLERTPAAAQAAAEDAAANALLTHGLSCTTHDLRLEMGGLEPGTTVSVALTCRADLTALAGLSLPGHCDVAGQANAVVDVYRSRP